MFYRKKSVEFCVFQRLQLLFARTHSFSNGFYRNVIVNTGAVSVMEIPQSPDSTDNFSMVRNSTEHHYRMDAIELSTPDLEKVLNNEALFKMKSMDDLLHNRKFDSDPPIDLLRKKREFEDKRFGMARIRSMTNLVVEEEEEKESTKKSTAISEDVLDRGSEKKVFLTKLRSLEKTVAKMAFGSDNNKNQSPKSSFSRVFRTNARNKTNKHSLWTRASIHAFNTHDDCDSGR